MICYVYVSLYCVIECWYARRTCFIEDRFLCSAKQLYSKKSFDKHKNDSRRTWQTINELTSRKSNTCSVKELIVDGVSISNPTEKVLISYLRD